MRCSLALIVVASTYLGATTPAWAANRLELTDENLPLQELRPLDRRVYILTLYGQWHEPGKANVYYVNFLFPNGSSYSHKILDPVLFHKGEVRCVIQGPQLIRNGLSEGGKFTIVISANEPVTSATAPQAISNAIVEPWPMNRPASQFRPYTKFGEPPPVDIFPIPGEILPPPPGAPKKTDKR
jgi:hypothetical protein